MKKDLTLVSIITLVIFVCTIKGNAQNDYCSYVNPFIGTGGHGHTFPGAVVPNGMIQPSPDTRIDGWDACSGYHYSDTTINGFSHTHLSGTGCCDYGDILLMPIVGKKNYEYTGKKNQQLAYASEFSHANETSEPGYYSVFLDRYKIKAEITATKRVAIHRYTFPESKQSGFIIDLDYSLQRQKNENMKLKVLSDTEIAGSKMTAYWAFEQYINFYAKFSKPFTYKTVDTTVIDEDGKPLQQSKILVNFETAENETVFVKVGISAVDIEGAKNNVDQEIPDWKFENVRNNARKLWNKYLSKIDIKTKDKRQKQIFYTALYHTAIAPNLFSDADGRYLGMDHKIRKTPENKPIYTVFSLWDTFRALHPLMTIIDPDLNNDFVVSLIKKYEEGGLLPMWELAANYTATMIGYDAVPVIVDHFMKGYRNFNVNKAFEACLKSARYDTANIITPPKVLAALVQKSKFYKNQLGYVPCNIETESVAKGLEYVYSDWCISQFAKEIGDTANYKKFEKLGKNYKNYFDKSTKFMRGLDSNGKWRTPFSPISSNHREDDYCEGNAWQWTWFVPHDVDGLVELMGGKEKFIAKLDTLFSMSSKLEGNLISADISGLIGQYAHGNEPSHHIIHFYNYVGESWKTQALADSVMQTLYFDNPNGLSGNEDCGQMSAWYILNSMGFYQVAPGNPVYSIGRPMFDEVTINLNNGKKFNIIAHNNSKKNKYVESVKLNGTALNKPFFVHKDIENGGTLEFVMTDKIKK